MKKILKIFTIDIISKLFAVISTVIIIRYMSTSEYADYTIITSFISVITGIMFSGFNRIYIVEQERIKNSKLNILIIQFVLILLLFMVSPLFIKSSGIFYVFMLLISTCLFHYTRTIYQQKCNFKTYAFIDLLKVIIFDFFLIMLMLCNLFKLPIVIIVQSISLASAIIFLISIAKKDNTIRLTSDYKSIINIFREKEQFILFTYFGLISILVQVDVISLRWWSDDINLASYSSAFKYYSLELMALETLNSIMLPEVNNEKSKEKIVEMYRQHNKLALIYLFVIIIAIILAPVVIPVIDKGKYPEAINIFRILSVSSLISFLGSPYINYLMKVKKYSYIVIMTIISIFASLVLNYFFINLLGAIGTAISYLIAFGINNMSVRIYAKILMKKS